MTSSSSRRLRLLRLRRLRPRNEGYEMPDEEPRKPDEDDERPTADDADEAYGMGEDDSPTNSK